MTNADDQLRGVDDPRLAIHATSSLPAWLWTLDGARVVWANPVGASLFGARNATALAAKPLHPADPHRRQVARLADRLPASGGVRLERLRGFGAPLGRLVTCGCARLAFGDGSSGILIVAAEPIGRPMPLVERLQRLVEGIDTPIASFASDGLFVGASDAARALLGFRDLTDAGLDAARQDALQRGRAELPIGIGHMVLQRVGSGADVALVALLAPGPASAEQPQPSSPSEPDTTPGAPQQPIDASSPEIEPVPEPIAEPPPAERSKQPSAPGPLADYEAPVFLCEAPAEFTVIDDHAEPIAEAPSVAADEPQRAESEQTVALDEVGPERVPATSEPDRPAIDHDTTARDTSADHLAAEVDADMAALDSPADETQPSPSVDTAAHEPVISPEPAAAVDEQTPIEPAEQIAAPSPAPVEASPAPAWCDEPVIEPRRHPLRFTWQLDAEGRFSIGSDEFSRLIGPRTSSGFGRLWSEIAQVYGLDPEGKFAEAIASRRTWSGITLNWPVDGPDQRLAVEMSGLPAQDRDGRYIGYRGFGVCRDLEGLTRLAALRRGDATPAASPLHPLSADRSPTDLVAETSVAVIDAPQPVAAEPPVPPQELETPVDTPPNVLPFRPANDARSPALTPVENSAFNELARQLSARLEHDVIAASDDATPEPVASPEPSASAEHDLAEPATHSVPEPANDEKPDWLSPAIVPARGDSRRDRVLLDLMPVGVLIYRLDRLLYANAPFLARMGYDSLHALEQAGGLDVLFVEPGIGGTSSASDDGTPITIAPTAADDDAPRVPVAARLHTIEWDGDSAMALIFADTKAEALAAEATADTPSIAAPAPSEVGHANAEELGAILDTTTDGIVMFDADGRITACNRSAEALFGIGGDELIQKTLPDLFAPESRRALQDYVDAVKTADPAGLLDHGRDLLGQVRDGGLIPLAAIIGRTSVDGPNYFAVFRDLSQTKKTETELAQARRQAEQAASAKADVLARLSHEIRAPLNAILGFAEVMIEERFGSLGNERYGEYMKDIRASGERVIGIVNDLLDLARIETGRLELSFTRLNLNELVEQCVGLMQPQANRERIIIRTSLAHLLPTVSADAQALRQITQNLIATSIGLANAGGQVIVSTALSDAGEVTLRVRDTGSRLNDDELAAAMQPFRAAAPSDSATEASGVNLSLTKALVEANRARFSIKTAPHSGTLIEVVFAQDAVQA